MWSSLSSWFQVWRLTKVLGRGTVVIDKLCHSWAMHDMNKQIKNKPDLDLPNVCVNSVLSGLLCFRFAAFHITGLEARILAWWKWQLDGLPQGRGTYSGRTRARRTPPESAEHPVSIGYVARKSTPIWICRFTKHSHRPVLQAAMNERNPSSVI